MVETLLYSVGTTKISYQFLIGLLRETKSRGCVELLVARRKFKRALDVAEEKAQCSCTVCESTLTTTFVLRRNVARKRLHVTKTSSVYCRCEISVGWLSQTIHCAPSCQSALPPRITSPTNTSRVMMNVVVVRSW